MSEDGLEKGFKLIGVFADEVFSKTIEMMKIHPMIALMNHNLLANLSFALTAEPTEERGREVFRYPTGPALEGVEVFDSRQSMVAHIFRHNAAKSGNLLGVEVAHKLFSSFSIDKLLGLLTGG